MNHSVGLLLDGIPKVLDGCYELPDGATRGASILETEHPV
jgi:hypothetical protein